LSSFLTRRFLGVSLEGCVSLSWPSTENFASDNFEVKKWHNIFFGVFLILSVHVLGGMRGAEQRLILNDCDQRFFFCLTIFYSFISLLFDCFSNLFGREIDFERVFPQVLQCGDSSQGDYS
jgi:hypothetical protein